MNDDTVVPPGGFFVPDAFLIDLSERVREAMARADTESAPPTLRQRLRLIVRSVTETRRRFSEAARILTTGETSYDGDRYD